MNGGALSVGLIRQNKHSVHSAHTAVVTDFTVSACEGN